MAVDCSGKIGKYVEALKAASFGDGEQPRGRQLTVGTAVSETDFAGLHQGAQFALGAVVGRFNAFLPDKRKQPWDVLEQHCGEISHITSGTVQMAFAQGE